MPPKKKTQAAVAEECINHTKSQLTLPDGTVLLIGGNKISASTAKLIRSCDLTQVWMKRKLISLRPEVQLGTVEYDPQWGAPASLAGLELEVIKECVAKCDDKDQLFKWLEGAAEPEIRDVITERAYALTIEQARQQAAV